MQRQAKLPCAGAALPARLAAIPVVRNDDPDVFRQLLRVALARLANSGEPLLVGLHDADPLLSVAQEFSAREYVTNVYIVYWPDNPPDLGQITRRVPYFELGAL